jgi:hypothetical protein
LTAITPASSAVFRRIGSSAGDATTRLIEPRGEPPAATASGNDHRLGCPDVTALARNTAAAGAFPGRLGTADVVEEIAGDFDLVIDGVGGRMFGSGTR